MYAKSRLQHGVEPYADANEAAVRGGFAAFNYDATRFGAGTAIFRASQNDGFIHELLACVGTTTVAASVLTVSINGVAIPTTVAIPAGTVAGTVIRQAFLGIDANVAVKKGDLITIQQAGATAGELNGHVWIDPKASI